MPTAARRCAAARRGAAMAARRLSRAALRGAVVRRWWLRWSRGRARPVAGCGSLPYGIDGDLTDEWLPPPGAAVVPAGRHRLLRRPAAGRAAGLVRAVRLPGTARRRGVLRRRPDRGRGRAGRRHRGRRRRLPAQIAAGRSAAGGPPRSSAPSGAPAGCGSSRCCPAGRLGGRRPVVPLRPRRGGPGHRAGGEPHRQPARRPRRGRAAGAACFTPTVAATGCGR